MNWNSIQISGHAYDVSHLSFRTYDWEIELKNKLKKVIKVDVHFSCHCFTRGPRLNEEIDTNYVFMNGKELRLFDRTRHELSKQLPALVSDLPNQKVYHTGYHNLVRVAVVDKFGEKTDYFVFLALSRTGKRMKMFIESAYPDDLLEDKKSYDKPIRFLIALRNAYEGR